MRYLLDTHAVLWWALEQDKLSRAARDVIADTANHVYFSPVNAMEIGTKVRAGKLDFARPLAVGFARQMVERGFEEQPLTVAEAEMAAGFGSQHSDPWDRLLAAQARVNALRLITVDTKMAEFGIETFW